MQCRMEGDPENDPLENGIDSFTRKKNVRSIHMTDTYTTIETTGRVQVR